MDHETARELARMTDGQLREAARFHGMKAEGGKAGARLHAEALANVKDEAARREAAGIGDTDLRDRLESLARDYGTAGIARALANMARESAAILDRQGMKEAARMLRVGSGFLDESAPFFEIK